LTPNIWRPWCFKPKITPMMARRTKISLHLSPPEDEAPQPSTTQNKPPIKSLPPIVEGLEHAAFGGIPEVELQYPVNNVSTTVAGSSQNNGGTSSTQTNGGASHQFPLRVPLPIQVYQENAELEQIQLEDWEDKAFEGKAGQGSTGDRESQPRTKSYHKKASSNSACRSQKAAHQ
jgi:hypothetical protein